MSKHGFALHRVNCGLKIFRLGGAAGAACGVLVSAAARPGCLCLPVYPPGLAGPFRMLRLYFAFTLTSGMSV